jgi:hypothetical protein
LWTEFREKEVDLRAEIQNFSSVYTQVTKWARSPLKVLTDPEPTKIPEEYSPYPKEFQALIQKK